MGEFPFLVQFFLLRECDIMRISKTFGERKHVLVSDNPKKKYFVAYEGSETERLYFDGIKTIKEKLGINSLLEIVPILRSCNEDGWSHPIRVLSCLMEFLHQMQTGEYKISSIIEWTIDYLVDEKIIKNCELTEEEVRQHLQEWFLTETKIALDDTVVTFDDIAEQVSISLRNKISIDKCIANLKQYLSKQPITYDPSYDNVCIIVDRDRQSFKETQYESVVKTCTDEGFQLYITNPCFEFWLLMHFDEVHNLDMEKVKGNVKVNKKCKYTESELRKLVKGYKKDNIQFFAFADKIADAIRNEKSFAEDVAELKNAIGSNIGLLITDLM